MSKPDWQTILHSIGRTPVGPCISVRPIHIAITKAVRLESRNLRTEGLEIETEKTRGGPDVQHTLAK